MGGMGLGLRGLGFRRGASAPAVNNLLVNSENFAGVEWTSNNLTPTTNTTAAPDGTTTADTLTESGTTANHYTQYTLLDIAASGIVHTFSIYAKPGTRPFQIVVSGVTGYATFNPATGTFQQSAGNSSALATMTLGTNGFYRCTLRSTTLTAVAVTYYLCLAQTIADANFPSYLGDGSSGVIVWGAQAEIAATAGAYQRKPA